MKKNNFVILNYIYTIFYFDYMFLSYFWFGISLDGIVYFDKQMGACMPFEGQNN